MKVLVINAGSASIKYLLYQMPEETVLAKGMVEKIGDKDSKLHISYNGKTQILEKQADNHEQAMKLILESIASSELGTINDIAEINAVGHRIVHGGEEFTGSVVINDEVIASIEKFADLAPLHNPPNLTGIKAAQRSLPDATQVACFDTSFHATIPQIAYMYALPYELYEKFRIRRYGFHGTSHKYVTERAADLLGKKVDTVNLITCHLGNGCSITAVKNGKSIDTSMGLTPLEGVVMGTRSGDFDPAILFYLADKGYSIESLNTLCNKKSGLLGISGVSNDMRTLTDLAQDGNEPAQLAIDIFCYRIKKYIGTYTAVLNNVDAVVFTGGIGENNPLVRNKSCSDLTQIGIELDDSKNNSSSSEACRISSGTSRVAILVVPTNEEVTIAKDTYMITQK